MSLRQGPESKLNALIGLVIGTFGWYLTSVLFGVKVLEYATHSRLCMEIIVLSKHAYAISDMSNLLIC